jgi:hypothetical protein
MRLMIVLKKTARPECLLCGRRIGIVGRMLRRRFCSRAHHHEETERINRLASLRLSKETEAVPASLDAY